MLTVSRRMGHARIKITADTYSHVFPEERTEADDRMDAMFAAAERAQPAQEVDLR